MKNKKNFIDGTFFRINKKIKKKIKSKYHKIKDWVMDPKGYFLIKLDNEMIAVIEGKTAIEIVNTLIKKNIFLAYNMLLIWVLN